MNAPASLRNPTTPWENEIWTPEPIFKGETVFCVASGPSLTQEIADKLCAACVSVIVVNSSCRFLPWADVLFFTDSGWYASHRDIVRDWPGLVATMSRLAKRELDDPAVNVSGKPRVLRVKGTGDPDAMPRVQLPAGGGKVPGFPRPGSTEIQQGRNSGNSAVSLAIALGAARVPLVAYDCRVVAGREHCHDEYKGPRDLSLYDNEFKRAFNGWNEAARASGVEIVNCTPGSAITEFPFADLDEVLASCAR